MTDDVQLGAGYYRQEVQFLATLLSMTRGLDLRKANIFGRSGQSGGEVALVVQNAFRDIYTEYAAHAVANGKIIFNRRAFLGASLKF